MVDPPAFAVLRPGDQYYETAAAAFRMQDGIGDTEFATLFTALVHDWPRARGRPVSTEERAITAFIIGQWRTTWRLALDLGVEPRRARELRSLGRHLLRDGMVGGARQWRVVADRDPDDHSDVYVAPVEPTPARRPSSRPRVFRSRRGA